MPAARPPLARTAVPSTIQSTSGALSPSWGRTQAAQDRVRPKKRSSLLNKTAQKFSVSLTGMLQTLSSDWGIQKPQTTSSCEF
eukprot:1953704-Pyramimonas_sp.AAC.1